MERYEMLKRLARPTLKEEETVKPLEEEPVKKPMTLETIMNAMKGSDQDYASKILSHIDPSLWDDDGVLIGVGIPVQDLILDLKNAENNLPVITAKRRQAIKHFIFKHTAIEPSMILNHKYVPHVKTSAVVVPVNTSIKHVNKPTMQFKWQERH